MKKVSVLLLAVLVSSCMTYQKAVKKFGHLAKDSVHVTVRDTLITRHDSVVLRIKTDTTRVHQVIQEGRARIIYDRTHTVTQVKAECLPDTIIKIKTVKLPPAVSFGIAPWHKTAFYVTLVLLLLAAIAYVFLYHLKLSIAKR